MTYSVKCDIVLSNMNHGSPDFERTTPENPGQKPVKPAPLRGNLRAVMAMTGSLLAACLGSQPVEAPEATPESVVPHRPTLELVIPEQEWFIREALYRDNTQSGLIYGQRFPVPCPNETVGFEFYNTSGVQGVGVYVVSGGFHPRSESMLFINPNKPDGTYAYEEKLSCKGSDNKEIKSKILKYQIELKQNPDGKGANLAPDKDTPQPVVSGIKTLLINDGSDCDHVKEADKSVLYKDPLSLLTSPIQTPLNPQIRYAIDVLQANGLQYDNEYANGEVTLLDVQLLPQGTMIQNVATPTEVYCLPRAFGFSRGMGLPVGMPDGKVIIKLSGDHNPILVRRWDSFWPGGDKRIQEYVVFNLGRDEEFTLANLDGSWGVRGRGRLAIPISRNDLVDPRQSNILARLILPESGFASDKPLKLLSNQFID